MTPADIVERIYEKTGFAKKDSNELVEIVFDIIKETLDSRQNIKVFLWCWSLLFGVLLVF